MSGSGYQFGVRRGRQSLQAQRTGGTIMNDTVTIYVDEENGGDNTDPWWEAAQASALQPLSRVVNALKRMGDEATCTRDEFVQFLAQAATLPGWDSGPEYAPHPINWRED